MYPNLSYYYLCAGRENDLTLIKIYGDHGGKIERSNAMTIIKI